MRKRLPSQGWGSRIRQEEMLAEGILQGRTEEQNAVDAGDYEELHDPFAGVDDADSASDAPTVEVVVDAFAYASGIDVGNIRDVDDGGRGCLLPFA